MKTSSLTLLLLTAIPLSAECALARGQIKQPPWEIAAGSRPSAPETVFAQSTSGQKSIIIVSGKNATGSSNPANHVAPLNNPTSKAGNPASKVMLNPQPLPPKTRQF